MRAGLRVWDADTHVNPAAEVLDRYVDPAFGRASPNWRPTGSPRPDDRAGRPDTHIPRRHQVLPADPGRGGAARDVHRPRARTGWAASMPRPGVQDDQAENRVKDMDDEGTDVHFLIPTSWIEPGRVCRTSALEIGMIRAYHRHMADFCGQYPDRLKSIDRRLDARRRRGGARRSANGAHRNGRSRCMPLLAKDIPVDHPDLDPIWRAAAGTRPADRASQLHLEPALLPGLPRSVGQHLPRPAGVASLGRDALCRGVHRRRHLRPLSEPAHGRARMRLRLAAVLGPAHGRAGGLCRRHRAARR